MSGRGAVQASWKAACKYPCRRQNAVGLSVFFLSGRHMTMGSGVNATIFKEQRKGCVLFLHIVTALG